MIIKNLAIKNFKSIEDIEMSLNRLTILIGANASGKSNIVNAFHFISDIIVEGLDNAIALQGGMEYLPNASLPKGTPIEVSFQMDFTDQNWIKSLDKKKYVLELKSLNYGFKIQPNKRGSGYKISSDDLSIQFSCLEVPASKDADDYVDLNLDYTLHVFKKSHKSLYKVEHLLSGDCNNYDNIKKILEEDITSRVFLKFSNENRNELMLCRLSILLPPCISEDRFIRIFDFDPKELKKPSSMASTKILKEDGSNIAAVLNNLLRVKEHKKKLTLLLKEFLPFVKDLKIENNMDKSFSYTVKETYSNKTFYANFLSDGTVSILAIIIALYFEELSNLVILEEPERNLHPKLLASILSAADDVSKDKQIIITTHNPEFIVNGKSLVY